MPRKLLLIVCAMFAISPVFPGDSSAAASPTLVLGTGPEPTESITTQLTASGTSTDGQTSLSGTVKPTGGEGCAANPQADSGQNLYFGLGMEEGAFSKSVNETFARAGSYLFCAWLSDEAQPRDPVVASAALTFTVRVPRLALSISAPATVRPGHTFQIVTTAQAEVERTVEEFVLPDTGRGCPANGAAARNTSGETSVFWPARFGSNWSVDGGPFSESVNEILRSAGLYLVCAYVEYPSSESPPEIAANAIVSAVVPPSMCVVPRVRAGSTLTDAVRLIRGAHCAVGRIRSTRSKRYRRGRVLRLGTRMGQRLHHHAPVEIIVSAGV